MGALRRERIPDFQNCTFDEATQHTEHFLKLVRNDEPERDAAPGIVFGQEPAAGGPLPGDRIVTLFVSTGPPSPPPISAIEVDDQLVEAGEPLQFAISIKPADAVGRLSYSITGGTAQPGRDYDSSQAKGDLAVNPDGNPLSITINTRAAPAVSGDLTLDLLVTADTEASDTATGTIHVLPLPCTSGREPSCPPCTTGAELSCPPCRTGAELSCPPRRPWWEEIIDDLAELPPWVWLIPGIGIGAVAVYVLRPAPVSSPPGPALPPPTPPKGSPPASGPPFEVATSYPENAAPPTVTSPELGPKSPVVSLIVKTTREGPRVVTTQSMEDKDA